MTREVKQILILDIAVASYVRARSPDPYMEESHGATPANQPRNPNLPFLLTRIGADPSFCRRAMDKMV